MRKVVQARGSDGSRLGSYAATPFQKPNHRRPLPSARADSAPWGTCEGRFPLAKSVQLSPSKRRRSGMLVAAQIWPAPSSPIAVTQRGAFTPGVNRFHTPLAVVPTVALFV